MSAHTVPSGGQLSLDTQIDPVPLVVHNPSTSASVAFRYAWIYNDAVLIAQPEVASSDPTQLGVSDSLGLDPELAQGSSGAVEPSTLVLYNLGPGELTVEEIR